MGNQCESTKRVLCKCRCQLENTEKAQIQLVTDSFYFFFQLDTLIFSFFTFTIFLYMFRTGWSIIRRIKCLITQAVSGTVPSVVDVSCVAVGVRLSLALSLTPTATHDTSTTEGTVSETACVIKHLILLMMDQPVRNM